jgi:hypothetical protein
VVFLIKLKNCCSNVSSALCTISCVLHFLYRCLSSTNPSFHEAIKEIAHVRPQCSLFLRVALSWSLSHYDLNSQVFFLVASLDFLNHAGNFRSLSDQSFTIICTRMTLDPISSAHRASFKGIWYPSLTKLFFLLCPFWHCSLIPSRS